MNHVLCYTLVALVIFVQKYECMETNKQQIKVIRAVAHYYNPKYIQECTYSISKKNDTYNNLRFRYTNIGDFPEDLRLLSIVYVTDSNYEKAKLLLQDNSFFSKDAKNYDLLPLFLAGSETSDAKYNKKGIFEVDDVGQFRFEILVPNLDKKGKYYKADYILYSLNETILFVTCYSEWGFLKNRVELNCRA